MKNLLLVLCVSLTTTSLTSQVLINRDNPITISEVFGISKNVNGFFTSKYAGMYAETTGSSIGKPFYGYAMDGSIKGYSYFDGADSGFHHYFSGIRQSIWQDSVAWTLGSGRRMLYEGYRLTLGDNGNVVLGYSSVPTNSPGNIGNTVLGALSAQSLTGGVSNTLVGNWSGWKMTTGDWNTIVGAQAGANLTTGTGNTLLGFYAGSNMKNNATGNVFIGAEAGRNEQGNNKLYIANDETVNPLIYGEFDTPYLEINGETKLDGPTTIAGTATISGATQINNQLTAGDIKIDDSNPFLEFKQLGSSKYYFQYINGNDEFALFETGAGKVMKIKDGEIYFPMLAGLSGKNLQIEAGTGKLIEAPQIIKYHGLDLHTHFENINLKWIDPTKDLIHGQTLTSMTVFVQWEQQDGTPDDITFGRISKYGDFAGPGIFSVQPPSATYAQEFISTEAPHVVDLENYTYYIVTSNSYLTVKEIRIE